MKIQDLENRTEMERTTIRFYEREGLLSPERRENGYRDYSEEDAELLIKIKLLRQLGVSVEGIKALQQGSLDLMRTLDTQIAAHSRQIKNSARARQVCQVIRTDGATFQTMDAKRYLHILQDKNPTTPFRESAPKKHHPWRRFIARMLDYQLFGAMVYFLLYVVLRVRPVITGAAAGLLDIGLIFVFIPVEALLLHIFGTTPGKWLMGIRIESADGSRLSYGRSLHRAWQALKYGLGLQIPILNWYAMLVNYCRVTGSVWRPLLRFYKAREPMDVLWDRDCELSYTAWKREKKALTAGTLMLLLLVNGVTIMDMFRPRYRGADLTIPEFAANYNAYVSLNEDALLDSTRMLPDGSWDANTDGIDLTSGTIDHYTKFQFETAGDCIRSIRYIDNWQGYILYSPMQQKCMNAVITAASAQDWCNTVRLLDFVQQYKHALTTHSGTFQYENIEIVWNMSLTDCTLHENGVLFHMEDSYGTLALDFEIYIRNE